MTEKFTVAKNSLKEKMNIVIVGHVDHGKSTVIGRLLADTESLPQGKLAQVKAECERTAKPFEYAFLLDALKDEQEQGITIDTARCFFKSEKREYIIIDAPGHIEFLKNMVSGAARAEAALLVIDAHEGIQENSKRHGYLLSMLGIRQTTILVNKMDLVGHKKEVFQAIEKDYRVFLKSIGLKPTAFIPVAARDGDNIFHRSEKLSWYKGPTVLEMLDQFQKAPELSKNEFRMPVQAVYRFTESGDDRRIFAGRIESGTISVGDRVVFLPSNKRSVIQTIEGFNQPKHRKVSAGSSTGVTLKEQIYVNRGEMMCLDGTALPQISSQIKTEIFWMGRNPFCKDKEYKLKLGTTSVPVYLKEILRVMDASDLSSKGKTNIERHDVAECILETARPVAFDLAHKMESTSRFVIVDDYDIAGGGIITESMDDSLQTIREQVSERELAWDFSIVEPFLRAQSYGHRPALVLFTGIVGVDKKTIAKKLEVLLFENAKKAYFLGIGNLLRGLDSDIDSHKTKRHEHVRRMGEVAHLFMEAGLIVLATASHLNDEELREIRELTGKHSTYIMNVGDNAFRDGIVTLSLDASKTPAKNAKIIFDFLGAQPDLFL